MGVPCLYLTPATGSKSLVAMGKMDKSHPNLQFELQKTLWLHEERAAEPEMGPASPMLEMGGELCQILTVMQFSLTKIDGKIESLSYHMDMVLERIKQHAEQVDMVERWLS
ncbi:hypothetical protein NDU88_010878 [Pleurodeles waltl]|uniref:Uncharacterized protein n=1 Tax=Pleurodeles waltl TaxID=8319 RepID=A0AAV7PX07_PLEWA|nr:hypothetical protein NDU88_010878 [Pleurodeles waltl]